MRCLKREKEHVKKNNKGQDLQIPHPKDKDKGKVVLVDQDGFQTVQHKNRGARRNIFGGQSDHMYMIEIKSGGAMTKRGVAYPAS